VVRVDGAAKGLDPDSGLHVCASVALKHAVTDGKGELALEADVCFSVELRGALQSRVSQLRERILFAGVDQILGQHHQALRRLPDGYHFLQEVHLDVAVKEAVCFAPFYDQAFGPELVAPQASGEIDAEVVVQINKVVLVVHDQFFVLMGQQFRARGPHLLPLLQFLRPPGSLTLVGGEKADLFARCDKRKLKGEVDHVRSHLPAAAVQNIDLLGERKRAVLRNSKLACVAAEVQVTRGESFH
jgi:hypothetical protein